MREPSHDQLVTPDQLLPINTQILPRLVRAARDGQAPGDQRTGVARPARLNRQARKIDVLTFPDDFLARRRTDGFRRHVPDGFRQRQQLARVLQPLRRLGFLERREQPAHVAQRLERGFIAEKTGVGGGLHIRFDTHAQRHAPRRTEQIAQHRHGMPGRRLKQQRRTARTQHAVAEFGHFKDGRNGLADAAQFAEGFEAGGEVAQVFVFHRLMRRASGEGSVCGRSGARCTGCGNCARGRLSILPVLMSVRQAT